MSDQTPTIHHEGAFLAALGIPPQQVREGTVSIEIQNGQPVVLFTLMVPQTWETLSAAMTAGATGVLPQKPKSPATRTAKKAAQKK